MSEGKLESSNYIITDIIELDTFTGYKIKIRNNTSGVERVLDISYNFFMSLNKPSAEYFENKLKEVYPEIETHSDVMDFLQTVGREEEAVMYPFYGIKSPTLSLFEVRSRSTGEALRTFLVNLHPEASKDFPEDKRVTKGLFLVPNLRNINLKNQE